MSIEVSPATALDAAAITLRASDLLEATEWLPGTSPYDALAASITHSTVALKGLYGDAVVFIAGYTITPEAVHPWLMCSDLVRVHGREVLRHLQATTSRLVAQHPDKLIGNYAYRDNLQAKRLLQFLGFRFVPSPGNGKFDFFYYPKCA